MQLEMFDKPNEKLAICGEWIIDHLRSGKVIDREIVKNLVTNEGLNNLLDVYLGGVAPIPTWYLGLFEGNYTPVATDTGATIASNSTETAAYAEGSRRQFQPAAASGQAVDNSANRAIFTFNATKTIYGGFLASTAVIGGTGGKCFSGARFATSKPVSNTDQLLITYRFTAASM